ncbi:interleukin-4 receptor subunit alpha-like [Eublepharis macularius]|uniref:Interleukin-4 receptor subunit alpha-like n=1 Tax=Eublepharis macularius TaxID=481883 RepID=A0AA97LKN7_EUBMA|nr:interleukin-4 receptor subunit alpha-like [Eublepharis macularius]
MILKEQFIVTKYTFSLESRRNYASRNLTVYLDDIVKPTALKNLTVSKSERRSFILTWRKDYNSSNPLKIPGVVYQIRISSEGQTEPILKNLTEQAERYEIFADTLLPGKCSASVRYIIPEWKSEWSEWSIPCEWSNDFKSENGDSLLWGVLLACFLVMVLVSIGYVCLARLKREWWDDIPSPGKSNLGKEFWKKPCLVVPKMFPGDEGKAPLCAPSQNFMERQRNVKDSPLKDEADFPGWPKEVAAAVPGSRLGGKWGPFFTPEVPSVEPSLTICSRSADTGPEALTEEEGDHVSHMDAFIDIFLDILGGGGHAGDVESPAKPVLEAHPSARAPGQGLGDLCSFGGTPGKSPAGSSESGYRNSEVAASAQAASPAPEQSQGDTQCHSATQYKLLLSPRKLSRASYREVFTDGVGPQVDSPGSSRATTPQPSCYKSLSSLVCPSPASFSQPWEHPLDLSRVDQSYPQGSWPSSCEEIAALFFPPRQEAPPQEAPGVPCTIDSCLPGYRPFRSALAPSAASQDPSCFGGGSPYKPFLGVLRSIHQEAQC